MSRRTIGQVGSLVAATVILVAITAKAHSNPLSISRARDSPSSISGQMSIPIPAVSSIASSSALPDALFVAFGSTSTPLYSLNGGITWQPVHSTPWADSTNAPLGVAVAPRHNLAAPVRLIVAASSSAQSRVGLYRTGDNGQTWTKISLPHPSQCNEPDEFTNLVASPADPSRLYVIKTCYDSFDPFYSFAFAGVYTSGDDGITWQAIKPDADGVWPGLVPSPVSGERVYLMDGSGNWHQSDNSGQTWTPRDFPVSLLALDAQNPDYLHGASGDVGRRSVDGGDTWSDWAEQPCLTTDDGKQLLAHPTLTNVLLMRCGSGLFHSSNGGDHWTKLSSWHGQWIGADYGNPGRILWARDDGLWASGDEGATWTKAAAAYQAQPYATWTNASPPDSVGRVNAIAPLSTDDAWAAGQSGAILRWQGQEWTAVTSPVTSPLNSLAFASPTDGWAVGDSAILRWDGSAWSVITDTVGLGLMSVDVISPTDAWAVGDGGSALHWDGDEWHAVATSTTLPLLSVDMVSSTDGWAVGGITIDDMTGQFEGVVLRWNGANWATYTTTNYILASVDMIASADGWITGGTNWASSGRLLHWDGVDWQQAAHPASSMLSSVSMASSTEGWAAGPYYTASHPTFLHWNGDAWAEASLPTDERLWSVAALSPDEAWVMTAEGSILRHRSVHHLFLPLVRR